MTRLRIGWPVGPFLLVLAAVQAVVGVLFFIRSPIATEMWPFPNSGEMTMIFLASIFAAAAASTTWAVLWGEPGSLVGIALDYLVIFVLLVIYLLMIEPARGGGLSVFVIVLVGSILLGVWMLWWAWSRPIRDPRPTPRPVRVSFVLFPVGLVLLGLALITGTPNILPWAVTPDLSVACGAIFLGAAAYFVYGLVRPSWSNAGGQLAGFLVYDLVLIVPFLTRFQTVYSGWSLNLAVYTAVLIVSGLLAAYYLFIFPTTRMFRARPVDAEAPTSL